MGLSGHRATHGDGGQQGLMLSCGVQRAAEPFLQVCPLLPLPISPLSRARYQDGWFQMKPLTPEDGSHRESGLLSPNPHPATPSVPPRNQGSPHPGPLCRAPRCTGPDLRQPAGLRPVHPGDSAGSWGPEPLRPQADPKHQPRGPGSVAGGGQERPHEGGCRVHACGQRLHQVSQAWLWWHLGYMLLLTPGAPTLLGWGSKEACL